MGRLRKATGATAVACALLAATAASAPAYPSQVSNAYKVGTIYGTCDVYVAARADVGVAVIGTLTGTESVHCEPLTITPYRISLSGWFSGTSLDVGGVTASTEPTHLCEAQDACYWSRSKGGFPPGDHEVTHDIWIDLTAQVTRSQQFTSVPTGCQVSSSDSGRLNCRFSQWVTVSGPVIGVTNDPRGWFFG